jgi:hypothetical protein
MSARALGHLLFMREQGVLRFMWMQSFSLGVAPLYARRVPHRSHHAFPVLFELEHVLQALLTLQPDKAFFFLPRRATQQPGVVHRRGWHGTSRYKLHLQASTPLLVSKSHLSNFDDMNDGASAKSNHHHHQESLLRQACIPVAKNLCLLAHTVHIE